MPVLETVAAVATIVSTFEAAANLYNGYKARREDKRSAGDRQLVNQNETLASLILGRTRVQEAYDKAYASRGVSFARGDGEGREQLQNEIIALQRTVIELLRKARDTGILNDSVLLSASEIRRKGAVRALVSQYQRMSTVATIEPPIPIGASRWDYFAFANNLCLEQMVERCPTSLFRGKATLHGYRWQINERGFANIVESPADYVEGLVFSVCFRDLLNLDRYEGVRKGYYERRSVSIELAEVTDGAWKTMYLARQLRQRHAPTSTTEMKIVEAFVYVSLTYIADGGIRAEYAKRMNRGIADAVALGMSREYVMRYLNPRIVVSRQKVRRRADHLSSLLTRNRQTVPASRWRIWGS